MSDEMGMKANRQVVRCLGCLHCLVDMFLKWTLFAFFSWVRMGLRLGLVFAVWTEKKAGREVCSTRAASRRALGRSPPPELTLGPPDFLPRAVAAFILGDDHVVPVTCLTGSLGGDTGLPTPAVETSGRAVCGQTASRVRMYVRSACVVCRVSWSNATPCGCAGGCAGCSGCVRCDPEPQARGPGCIQSTRAEVSRPRQPRQPAPQFSEGFASHSPSPCVRRGSGKSWTGQVAHVHVGGWWLVAGGWWLDEWRPSAHCPRRCRRRCRR
jgi:hypothetical protein